MGVPIYETRRNDLALRIDGFLGRFAFEIADGGYNSVGHADIGTLARQTRPVHDGAALNQKIICHGVSFPVCRKR